MAFRASETPSFPFPSRSTSSRVVYLRSSLFLGSAGYCKETARGGVASFAIAGHIDPPSCSFRDSLLIGILDLGRIESIKRHDGE
jgi:hypothetical protein